MLTDPANRNEYMQFMQVVASLEWERSDAFPPALGDSGELWTRPSTIMGKPGVLITKVNASPNSDVQSILPVHNGKTNLYRRLKVFRSFPVALCASLATLIAVLSIQHWSKAPTDPTATPLAATSQPMQSSTAPIAYLSSATGYRWGDDSPHLHVAGSPVSAGEAMTLQEGVAEFRLSSGVQLNLEGPAGIIIASPNSLVLQYGKLTAYLPESATEFKVMAGASRLMTSGAAFGVDLGGGDMELHVFSGEVTAVNTSFMESYRDFVVDDKQQDDSVGSPDHVGLLEQVTVVHGRSLTLKDDRESVYVTGWAQPTTPSFLHGSLYLNRCQSHEHISTR